ncbi:hypothetical protein SCLCIDRAFT_343668 [Scleroderma citrinum Foug A]|uniref:Uncharacterized protein n=1 Tax=Scleroderma citrinum Foug A TaxID=1036808 RepID=A0A0C2YYM8_9AGAM|nr:hypothetical protein SCLCIDRAFT_343668 [Scleroderma citrinum Foug A]
MGCSSGTGSGIHKWSLADAAADGVEADGVPVETRTAYSAVIFRNGKAPLSPTQLMSFGYVSKNGSHRALVLG